MSIKSDPGSESIHTCSDLDGISEVPDNISIDELYRCRSESCELQCHRLNVGGDMAGELIMKMAAKKESLSIEELFIERQFRNSGMGTRLLLFAEWTASILGFSSVELRPFSADPAISDIELQQWYRKRGYRPGRGKLRKRVNRETEATL